MPEKPMTDFEHQCLAALVEHYGIVRVITTAVNIHVYQKEEAEDAADEYPDYDDQGNLKPGIDH